MSDLLRSRKGVDTLMTEVAYASYQAESLIPFVAPTVTVNSRSGKILTFGKEQFAVSSTKRAPYANHRKSGRVSGYNTNLAYVLEQHTHEAEVSWEEIEEASLTGCNSVNIDLRELAVMDAVAKVEQSLEQEMYNLITNPANYEPGNVIAVAGTNQLSNAGSDPEALVMTWKSIVRGQTGRYPTRAVISEDVYRALMLHPIFRDRTKYTTSATADLGLLASWLGLPGGIQVALRQTVNAAGQLTNMFPNGTMLLFVDGRDKMGGLGSSFETQQPLFRATPGVNVATATFAQLYTLREGLTVGKERIVEDNDTIVSTIRFTGGVFLPSVGSTNRANAGVLVTNLI
jgi:hypothetical protein